MQPILEAMRAAASTRVPGQPVTPEQMRVRAASQFEAWNREPPALAGVRDLDIPIGAATRRARWYDPDGHSPAPLLLYLHGGGWVVGDLDIEDRALRVLALESGARILSLDYRLAPGHPFPAAIEDTMAAFAWLRAHAQELGGSARALALGGASAGANLALATALRLRDEALPLPAQLVLFYGVYGVDRDTESDRLFGTPEFSGPLANMEFFYASYAGSPEQRRDPLVAPLLADLHGLPPTFLNAAGIDPLRDDSRQLRDRTQGAERGGRRDQGGTGRGGLTLQQPGLETDGDGMTAVARPEFFEHVAKVEANGRGGDRQGIGNLGVAVAAGEAFEDGNLALAQVGKYRFGQQHPHQRLVQHRAQGTQSQRGAGVAVVRRGDHRAQGNAAVEHHAAGASVAEATVVPRGLQKTLQRGLARALSDNVAVLGYRARPAEEPLTVDDGPDDRVDQGKLLAQIQFHPFRVVAGADDPRIRQRLDRGGSHHDFTQVEPGAQAAQAIGQIAAAGQRQKFFPMCEQLHAVAGTQLVAGFVDHR